MQFTLQVCPTLLLADHQEIINVQDQFDPSILIPVDPWSSFGLEVSNF